MRGRAERRPSGSKSRVRQRLGGGCRDSSIVTQQSPWEAVSSSVSAVPRSAVICRVYATTLACKNAPQGQRRAMVPRCHPSSGHQ